MSANVRYAYCMVGMMLVVTSPSDLVRPPIKITNLQENPPHIFRAIEATKQH